MLYESTDYLKKITISTLGEHGWGLFFPYLIDVRLLGIFLVPETRVSVFFRFLGLFGLSSDYRRLHGDCPATARRLPGDCPATARRLPEAPKIQKNMIFAYFVVLSCFFLRFGAKDVFSSDSCMF